MTVGQAVAVVALLSQMYSVDPALMDCIVYHESSYNVAAQNGECVGLVQWRPSTRDWLGEKAQADPLWLHGDVGDGPVYDVALAAWAVRNGFGTHWSTYPICGGD